jgi:hypothetical protein
MAKYDGAQSLPGALIGRIEGIVKSVCPDAVFEYDEASMMNVKADDIERDKSFVYIEELTQSRIETPKGRPASRVTPVQIYFCRFEPLHNDAWHGDTRHSQAAAAKLTVARQAIRDSIENEMVLPVVERISQELQRYSPTYTFRYPPSRFDANEVAVMLEVTITDYICLDFWKR